MRSPSLNSDFFKLCKSQWWNTKQLYFIWYNVEEWLSRNIIKITTTPIYVKDLEDGHYHFLSASLIPDCKFGFNKYTTTVLKLKGIPIIQCQYWYSHPYYLRVYQLIPKSKIVFAHYRVIHDKRKENINLLKSISTNPSKDMQYIPIKILKYSPAEVWEDSTGHKIWIIIESSLSYDDWKKIEKNVFVSFGRVFVKCEFIANNIIECEAPSQKEKEVIVDINMTLNNTMIKVSYYDTDNKIVFKYLPQRCSCNTRKNVNNNFASGNSPSRINSKIKFPIFNYTPTEMIDNVIHILRDWISQIEFYSKIYLISTPPIINLTSLSNNFTVDLLNATLRQVCTELVQWNKLYLLEFSDNNGYNIWHYICSLNYDTTLNLLNSYKFSFETKTKDGLSSYEICAGRRNLECLQTLINIIDNVDMEINNNDNYINNEEKFWYDFEVLKSALSISWETKKIDTKDLKVWDLWIKQIKIKYTVDSTSGKIIENMQNKAENMINNKKDNVKCIQRAVRGWLRRSQYKNIKKAANRWIDSKCLCVYWYNYYYYYRMKRVLWEEEVFGYSEFDDIDTASNKVLVKFKT